MAKEPRYIRVHINGVPYGGKGHGSAGANEWTERVKAATVGVGQVREACILNVTFHLDPQNYVSLKYGTDIDNLLTRFLDALKKTIFANAPGDDSCVIAIHAVKRRAKNKRESGADLEILPVSVPGSIS